MLSALTSEDILFHVLGAGAVLSAIAVVFLANPVFCALFLALCMSLLGIIFFTLGAYFIAAAQITVYAGAVMVLFVMVLMLFDLKKEHEDIFKVTPLGVTKIVTTGLLCGFLIGAGWLSAQYVNQSPVVKLAPNTVAKDLSKDQPVKPGAAAITPETLQNQDTAQAEESLDEDLVVDPRNTVPDVVAETKPVSSTLQLSQTLFSKWIVAFEAVGLVILLVTIGVVALAKSRGGTHHAS